MYKLLNNESNSNDLMSIHKEVILHHQNNIILQIK